MEWRVNEITKIIMITERQAFAKEIKFK
jgi:hypothetical protein